MALLSGLTKQIGSLKQLRLIIIFFSFPLLFGYVKMSETHTASVEIQFDFSNELLKSIVQIMKYD